MGAAPPVWEAAGGAAAPPSSDAPFCVLLCAVRMGELHSLCCCQRAQLQYCGHEDECTACHSATGQAWPVGLVKLQNRSIRSCVWWALYSCPAGERMVAAAQENQQMLAAVEVAVPSATPAGAFVLADGFPVLPAAVVAHHCRAAPLHASANNGLGWSPLQPALEVVIAAYYSLPFQASSSRQQRHWMPLQQQ